MSPRPKPQPMPCPEPEARPVTTVITLEEQAPSPARQASSSADEPRILTPRTGWVIGVAAGRLLVDYPGNRRGPLPARSTVPLDARGALSAAASRQGALLVFEDGDPEQPVLIGLVQPAVETLIDLVLEASAPDEGGQGEEPEGQGGEEPTGARDAESARALSVTAEADGKRLVLEGEEEVTLRCGQASISLRRDGRVVVRGAYVETHASGTNRIKGGSVLIN